MSTNSLQFLGPWDPTSGAFPIIPSNATSAYYFVDHAGTFNSFNFEVGDWLLFIEDSVGNGTWYQTTGGVIQIALSHSDFHGHSYTHGPVDPVGQTIGGVVLPNLQVEIKQALGTLFQNPSGNPVVFTYDPVANTVVATVKHDDTLDITNAGQLRVVSSGGSSQPSEITPDDIVGFDAAVIAAVGANQFASPSSKAVQFAFDPNTSSVSADVKIDGSSITKNNLGQLQSNPVGAQLAAPQQIIGLPTSGNYDDGAENLANMKIVDAVATLNRLIKVMEAALDVAEAAPSLNLGDYTLTFAGTTVTAKAVSDGTDIQVYTIAPTVPQVGPFKRVNGNLNVFLDSTLVGTLVIDTADLTGQVNGDLTVVHDTDLYEDIPFFFGRYKVLDALVTILDSLTEGTHEIILQSTGDNQSVSNVFNFADTNVTGSIDEESSTIITFGAGEHLSGVPVLSTPNVLVGPLFVDNVAKQFYQGTDIVELASPSLHFDVATPTSEPTEDNFTVLETNSLSGTLPGSFFSSVSLDFTIFTIGHKNVGTQNVTIPKRWDASIVLETSGNPIARIDSGSGDFDFTGSDYDSTVSLVDNTELQIENRKIKFPTQDYTTLSGPDYSGIVQGSAFRYCTLVETSGVTSATGFDLDLRGLTTINGSNPLKVLIKVGSNPVVDATLPYNSGNTWQDGVPGWDQTATGLPANVRRITFGSHTLTGPLYIKVAYKGADYELTVPTSWIFI